MGFGSLFDLAEVEDQQWLLSIGKEIPAAAGVRLIEEGKQPDAMYIVMSGLVRVHSLRLGDRQIAALGPGEIIGDISFVTGGAAAASVTVLEDATLLELPKATLTEKIAADSAFGARFYRVLSGILAQRLVDANAHRQIDIEHHEEELLAGWQKLESAIGAFQEIMRQADKLMIERKAVPEELPDEVQRSFEAIVRELHAQVSNEALSPAVRQELGLRVQKELLPWLLLGDTVERCYSKPRGYAGDYEVIERLYANQPHGTGRIGALVDLCFLNTIPARIVRGRRSLFASEVSALVSSKADTTRVCVLASGPAGEVFDAYELLDKPERLQVSLVDFDPEALKFVAQRMLDRNVAQHIRLINENPIFVALGRKKLALADQDLVYSLGLIDYFNDKLVVKLLNVIHDMLRPGGRVILGNYHPVNPARELMDHVLDWKLIHRTEEDMHRLFQESAFGKPCSRIQFEEQGVDLFAECAK